MNTALVVGHMCGWAYAATWAACGYPQVIQNHNSKSVAGVSTAYIMYQLSGSLSYYIYNSALVFPWFYSLQRKFKLYYNLAEIPAHASDMLFSVNSTAVAIILFAQYFYFHESNSKVSPYLRFSLLSYWCFTIFALILSLLTSAIEIVVVIQIIGLAKLVFVTMKYVPQVIKNQTLRSTKGWSITSSWLDLIGGVLCILNLVCLAIAYRDINLLFVNVPKLGLAIISILFSGTLILQHCIFSRHTDKLWV
ncbi:cystinosin precursor [Pelomyxa schiedti]|nr:cystinosin precursor [Pelomyxa schiedti]